MKTVTLAFLAALSSTVTAITVVSPAQSAQWDISKSNTIEWTSVQTDPTTISVVLVDNTSNPPFSKMLAQNITTSSHSYTVKPLCNVPNSAGYQVDLSDADGIRAQSQQINITGADAADKSCAAASSTTSLSSSPTAASTQTAKSSSAASANRVAMGLGAMLFGVAAAFL